MIELRNSVLFLRGARSFVPMVFCDEFEMLGISREVIARTTLANMAANGHPYLPEKGG